MYCIGQAQDISSHLIVELFIAEVISTLFETGVYDCVEDFHRFLEDGASLGQSSMATLESQSSRKYDDEILIF